MDARCYERGRDAAAREILNYIDAARHAAPGSSVPVGPEDFSRLRAFVAALDLVVKPGGPRRPPANGNSNGNGPADGAEPARPAASSCDGGGAKDGVPPGDDKES